MKKTPTLLDLYEAIKPKYLIFCDMDGVLVDFDQGYKDLTGMSTKEADSQGKEAFSQAPAKSSDSATPPRFLAPALMR